MKNILSEIYMRFLLSNEFAELEFDVMIVLKQHFSERTISAIEALGVNWPFLLGAKYLDADDLGAILLKSINDPVSFFIIVQRCMSALAALAGHRIGRDLDSTVAIAEKIRGAWIDYTMHSIDRVSHQTEVASLSISGFFEKGDNYGYK